MKQNKFLKALIIIAAILVVGYIVYNSYQVTEVRNLVDPLKAYSFSNHVDSMCAKIQSLELKEAVNEYTALYQEIDVVSKIKTKNENFYLSSDSADYLFENSFEAVWPLYKNFAENLFSQNSWRSNDLSTIKNCYAKFHIGNNERLDFKKGVSNQETLKRYRNYVKGYYTIKEGLSIAETCSNKNDYDKVVILKKYQGFPYSNLRILQEQIEGAEGRAADHWQQVLKQDARSLLNQEVEINQNSISTFSELYNDWGNRKKEFEETLNDESLQDLQNELLSKIAQLQRSLNELTRQN